MWHSIMTLPDGAEISVHVPSGDANDDAGGVTYRVSRHGKKIGDFTELRDIALFARYRHDQATHDAFITAAQQQVSTSQRSPQVPARTR